MRVETALALPWDGAILVMHKYVIHMLCYLKQQLAASLMSVLLAHCRILIQVASLLVLPTN